MSLSLITAVWYRYSRAQLNASVKMISYNIKAKYGVQNFEIWKWQPSMTFLLSIRYFGLKLRIFNLAKFLFNETLENEDRQSCTTMYCWAARKNNRGYKRGLQRCASRSVLLPPDKNTTHATRAKTRSALLLLS